MDQTAAHLESAITIAAVSVMAAFVCVAFVASAMLRKRRGPYLLASHRVIAEAYS